MVPGTVETHGAKTFPYSLDEDLVNYGQGGRAAVY